jgi:hypothetical protein
MLTKWEKVYANHKSGKKLTTKIYKEFNYSRARKQRTQFKNGQRTKKDIKKPNQAGCGGANLKFQHFRGRSKRAQLQGQPQGDPVLKKTKNKVLVEWLKWQSTCPASEGLEFKPQYSKQIKKERNIKIKQKANRYMKR